MRATLLAAAAAVALLPPPAAAQAAPAPAPAPAPAITPDPAAPRGKLPAAARPTAYRLDFTIDPDRPRFAGHDEIDAVVAAPTRRLYLHGRDLAVSRVAARVPGPGGTRDLPATYTPVDPTGVVRLDFAQPLPAGPVTLVFDYTGAFGENASGLYRVKVKDRWYSWTQFESIDARAAFPSFDEPGFKTPFAITVTTPPGNTVVSNAPAAGTTRVGPMERHAFEPTRPLPTYLVALVTGPFKRITGAVPATPERPRPLPLGVVATQAQAGDMAYALAESPRIVTLLEHYFGGPFPFAKLDQIGSPVMPGAMENAGADIYADGLLLQGPGATTGERQAFGMVVSHELSHQWFGDLVSPAWWDDIWLNESFANWMGYRIGDEWRPELNIGVGALAEGFRAMNTDSLAAGRPIHQHIERNNQIDSAFDAITYGKGGQVVAMIAAYLGDAKFRDGVRLHLSRHRYGNATSEQFFAALADAARDPGVLASLKSFVDQPGVPLVTITRRGGELVATQGRYALLGTTLPAERWTVPVCWRADAAKACTLLADASATLGRAPAGAVVMPNVGGTGYYRFELPAADWASLIAAGGTLPAGEALAASDSLWASFRAGRAPATALLAAIRSFAANPDASAAVAGGERLAGFRARGYLPADALPAYRRLMVAVYGPRLAALRFDPAHATLAGDTPEQQRLREALVGLVAEEGEDPAVTAALRTAAQAYLAGDERALAPSYLGLGLTLVARAGGLPAARRLVAAGLAGDDPVLRRAALGAAASGVPAADARALLDLGDGRLRGDDRLEIIGTLANRAETSGLAATWIYANYARLASGNGIFLTSRLPAVLGGQCGVDEAARLQRELGPKVHAVGAGELEFERSVEQVRSCGVLRAARGAELAAAVRAG